MISKHILRSIVPILLCSSFYSCVEPIVGCLDPESVNYQLDADEACEDECCVFPEIDVSIFHQYQDTALFLGDTLTNTLDQDYSIIDFVYFLSDWQFKDSDGQWHTILDSISLNSGLNTLLEKDDVLRVSRNNFTYNIGTTIFDGSIEEIQFRFGISENFNTLDFTNPISNHPLTSDPDSLRTDDGYVMLRIQIAQGENLSDTIIYDVSDNTQLSPILFQIEAESLRGNDKNVVIQALYNRWFDAIDFGSMDQDAIESHLALQMQELFEAM